MKPFPSKSTTSAFPTSHCRAFYAIGLVSVILYGTSINNFGYSQRKDVLPDQVKSSMAPYLLKMSSHILGKLKTMADSGITADIRTWQNLKDRFSDPITQLDERGRFLVHVYVKQVEDSVLHGVESSGGAIKNVNRLWSRITAWVPFSEIETLAANGLVNAIVEVGRAYAYTGSVTTKGDTILSSLTERTDFVAKGGAIKVGVISGGALHWQSVVTSGDLPSSIDVIYNNFPGDDDEGTAMMEIVYDIAPSCTLAYSDPGLFPDDQDMANVIDTLMSHGCKIIVDDLDFLDEPAFDDGVIAQMVNSVVSAGVVYVSAAGNSAQYTWQGMFTDDGNGWNLFSGSDNRNSLFLLNSGEAFYVTLQWANKFGFAGDDYDLYLFNSQGTVLDSSTTRQNGNGVPFEELYYVNDVKKRVYIGIKKHSGQARDLQLKVWPLNTLSSTLQYTTGYSIFGHQAANSCISVGANSASTPDVIEGFSSLGPSRIYTYDSQGNPLSSIDRQSIKQVGIDGVETKIGQLAYFYDPFFGTSAAAPHVAGVAALVLSLNPQLTPAQVQACLDSAADKVSNMGGADYTNIYGFGRTNAYKAAKYAIEHYSTTIGGQGITITLPENVTTSAGTTLMILPGTSVQTASGAMLIINGQLNAQGTTSHPITFDRIGTSGSWYGLVLQSGSSGTVGYCNFNHATVGVSCNSSSTTITNSTFLNNYYGIYCNPCTPTIQNNDIENSTNSGIYLTGASPNLQGNTIKNNSQYGVFCLNHSSPGMTSNTISESQVAGLYCDSYSSPTLSSIAGVGNVISLTGGSAIDIQAGHYSNPFLGFGGSSGNSIEGSPWYYVSATYGSNVIAQGNWWGSYPPNSSRFNVYPQGSVDYSRALTSDPNPGRPKVQAPGEGEPLPTIAFISDSTFNLAFQDGLAGKYDDAIILYLKVYNSNPKTSLLAKQAILFLAETYERSGKTEFIDLLHSQIDPTVPPRSELSVISRELEAYWLTKTGSYNDAINMYQALHADYPDSAEIDKHALFNIGEIYQSFLGNHSKAVEYFTQFRAEYPNDPLSSVAGFLMTSAGGSFLPSLQEGGGTIVTKDPMPTGFALESNYPNPFNPSTQIRYSLPEAGNVSLMIYDVLGREVATLADAYQQSGRYTVTWNSTQNSGIPVSSGVYFARLRVTNDLGGVKFTKTTRLLLMK